MKRPIQPFVVQHKKRQRSQKTEEASIWSGEAGREMRALLQADEAPEVAEVKAEVPHAVGTIAGKSRAAVVATRILEEKITLPASAIEESVSETQKVRRPRGRPRKAAVEAIISLPDASPRSPAPSVEPTQRIEVVSAPISAEPRPTRIGFRERRRVARASKPLGERWRWNLKY